MNILDEIAQKTRVRVEKAKENISLETIKKQAVLLRCEEMKEECCREFIFEKALKEKGLSFICEVKKASPSKGIIAKEFPYVDIAKAYENGGAAAISVLTEPDYFMGSLDYLKEIRKAVDIPLLRKDFTIDEYMIYEAKLAGTDAILLICALLNDDELRDFFEVAELLGISAIFEAHDEAEVNRAIKAGAHIIGVNNRNLKNFDVNINNSIKYRNMIPDDIIFISESGVRDKDDLVSLRKAEVDAVLIGEALMRSNSPADTLRDWKKAD